MTIENAIKMIEAHDCHGTVINDTLVVTDCQDMVCDRVAITEGEVKRSEVKLALGY